MKKDIKDISVVINGSGAAGIAVAKLLMSTGLRKVILCDRKGAIYKGRDNLNKEKEEIAAISNVEMKKGILEEVIKGQMYLLEFQPLEFDKEMIKTMAKDLIILPWQTQFLK